ncbi:MAG: ice-binding family protein, partial [Candidatus Limnocylindrales bacterium]
MQIKTGLASVLLAPLVTVTLALGLLAAGGTANAAGPTPVDLGTAAPFAVLAGTPAVTNTGPTLIGGDLGISPAASVTGFPPGTVSGTIHAADAVALQAQRDLGTAYTDAAGRTPATALAGGALGGKTLVPGVYTGSALALTGTLTLDGAGDPNAVWIFQAGSSLVTASSSAVRFINDGQPCNVFWQVTSSATLGSGSAFAGNILALTSITLGSGVTLDGRALARNGDVTLIDDTIMPAICSAASPTPSASPTASASATPAASPTPSASPTASASATP